METVVVVVVVAVLVVVVIVVVVVVVLVDFRTSLLMYDLSSFSISSRIIVV